MTSYYEKKYDLENQDIFYNQNTILLRCPRCPIIHAHLTIALITVVCSVNMCPYLSLHHGLTTQTPHPVYRKIYIIEVMYLSLQVIHTKQFTIVSMIRKCSLYILIPELEDSTTYGYSKYQLPSGLVLTLLVLHHQLVHV